MSARMVYVDSSRPDLYLLGFSEQGSFFRACKRWFGLPPGEYRQHLQRVQAE